MAATIPPGLIVNADDLAIHPRINAGILSAFRSGILTSATMLMTTPYVAATAREIAGGDGPPIGIHLALTLGAAVAGRSAVPDLVDEHDNFIWSSRQLLLRSFANAQGRKLLDQIRRELAAQLGRARDLGLQLTHADSHQHVHMNPAIFAIVEELLPRFGIARLRLSRERLTPRAVASLLRHGKAINLAKIALLRWISRGVRPRLATTDAFIGVVDSGVLSKETLAAAIAGLRDDQSLEICIHPGFSAPRQETAYPLAYVNDFIASPARRAEHDILVDPDIRELVRRRGVVLRDFAGRVKT